jgi:hypothetical protein
MNRIFVTFAAALSLCVIGVGTGCADGVEDQNRPTPTSIKVEVRLVREQAPCPTCMRIDLPNLYTRSASFNVDSEVRLVIDGAKYIQPVFVKGGYPSAETWRIRIDMPSEQKEKLRHFREASHAPQQPILISLNGRPVDVITIGGLASVLMIGSFDSTRQIEDLVGKPVGPGVVEVVLDDSGRDEFQEMENQLEDEEHKKDLVIQLQEAMKAGDDTSAERIQEEISSGL